MHTMIVLRVDIHVAFIQQEAAHRVLPDLCCEVQRISAVAIAYPPNVIPCIMLRCCLQGKDLCSSRSKWGHALRPLRLWHQCRVRSHALCCLGSAFCVTSCRPLDSRTEHAEPEAP